MSGTDLILGAGVLLTILIAVFLSLAETALVRMSRIKAIQLADEERRGAASLLKLMEDPARFLNIILLLVLVVQIGGASLATLLADRLAGSYGWIISTVGMTLLTFVFAEAAPKTYAIQHSEKVSLRIAPIISALIRMPGLQRIVRALVSISNIVTPGKGLPMGPFVTEDEIRTMAEVAADEASIEEDEKEMIHSIFEFGDTVVREVMIPRPDMFGIDLAMDLSDVLTEMLEHGFSRMPVFQGGNPDKIAGLVYAKDVMHKLHAKGGRNGKRDTKPRLKDLVRKAMFVPESKRVAQLLREMQAKKTHMAIVVDEYGDTSGLVTLEDLLEEIVGEIADEYDREEPQVQPIDENTMLVTGRLQIDELSELLDVELPNTEWDTVGGLMAGLLGKLPARGEEVVFQGLTFRAERVQGRRIAKVLIVKAPKAGGER